MQITRLPDIPLQPDETVIAPQPGPQTMFLATGADICIYGGAAGGGKSVGLLLSALRYAALEPKPTYGAVIFRRTGPQITQQGGLWDQAGEIYPLAGGQARKGEYRWPQFRTRIRFASMQYNSDRFNWQGAQIPFIGFDELTHFDEEQFFYMLSRNRSTCGVRPVIRATTNPDADSWVKKFLAPWVDEKWPVDDRAASGEIRWFIREDGLVKWLRQGEWHPDGKSVTFIAASIYDNPALLTVNPEYLINLKSLPLVERERLLNSNWAIRREGGRIFKKHWFRPIEVLPADIISVCRFWDLAATEDDKKEHKKVEEKGGPDYTAGVLVGKTSRNTFVVIHAVWDRVSPLEVETMVKNYAAQDRAQWGKRALVAMEQEPGSSGKTVAAHFRRNVLAKYHFKAIPSTGDKLERARIPSSHAEMGNIEMLVGPWNEGFLNFLEAFPSTKVHDDIPDAFDGATLALINFVPTIEEHIGWANQYAKLLNPGTEFCPYCGAELVAGEQHRCQ